MRILVVDAYNKTAKGRQESTSFKNLVASSFEQLKIHVHLQVKRSNDLGEFLYEEDTKYSDPMGVKKFDRLDMIFIGGNPTLMPWDKAIRQVNILLRMCYLTNKCLFASSFACHLLAHICCTGGEHVSVLNGENGRGSKLSTIADIKITKDFSRKDCFFDCETGDLYKFNPDSATWFPYCHSGLRQRAKYATHLPRKYMPKEPYGKHVQASVVPAFLYETKLTLRTAEIQHWAFRGLKLREFLVPRRNLFDIDEKASGTSRRKFFILADSDQSLVPQVIESGHMFGTQFPVTLKYPETAQIMQNYVKQKYNQMNAYEYLDVSSAFLLVGRHGQQGTDPPHPPAGTVPTEKMIFKDPRVSSNLNSKPRRPSSGKKSKSPWSNENRRCTPCSANSSGIINDTPPAPNPPYSTEAQQNKSAGILSHTTRRATPGTGRSSAQSSSPVAAAVDPSLIKPSAPVDRMEKIAMTCNARVFQSTQVKPGEVELDRVILASPNAPRNSSSVNQSQSQIIVERVDEVPSRALDKVINIGSHGGLSASKSIRSGSNVTKYDDLDSLCGKDESIRAPSRFESARITKAQRTARIVRVKVKKRRPFCAWDKTYKQLNVGEEAFGQRDVGTVTASGPYISDYKSQRLEYMRGKMKWVSPKMFQTYHGQANTLMTSTEGKIDHGKYKANTGMFRDPDNREKWMNPFKGWRNN
jgi:hypothetical protein